MGPRVRLDGGALRTRPHRPQGGDHRAGGAQDDDQRAQLRRAGLHGGLRGRTLAALDQRRHRAAQLHGRRAAHARVREPRRERYALGERLATLVVRPRGGIWKRNTSWRRPPVPASLVDFGLYFFHNARELLARGSGPYFYLPKLESHLEARLWNDVFNAQDALALPRGSIRATVLIETILAAFEMDEILYELRDHAAGLNAAGITCSASSRTSGTGRSSFCPTGRSSPCPCRSCGPIPSCWCAPATAATPTPSAAWRVHSQPPRRGGQRDRLREGPGGQGTGGGRRLRRRLGGASRSGARGAGGSTERSGERPHQKERRREEVRVGRRELLDVGVPGARITAAGLLSDVSVALQYLEAWLRGSGAVAINNMMEDTATAEIARARSGMGVHASGPRTGSRDPGARAGAAGGGAAPAGVVAARSTGWPKRLPCSTRW